MPRTKRKRIALGMLMANSARKVIETVRVIYDPRNYNIVRRVKDPDSLEFS